MITEILGSYDFNCHDSNHTKPFHATFLKYFAHPWSWIVRSKGADSWKTESAYPIQPANLWHYWQDPEQIIGLRFGDTTLYGLIDIDRGSAYHPANSESGIARIREALETVGIYRTVLVRSSDSEGLHLYFAFSESVPTFDLAIALDFAMRAASLCVGAGTLELFPNAKRYRIEGPSNYMAHRLPLQSGSFLLDSDFQPVTNEVESFISALDSTARGNDIHELLERVQYAKNDIQKRKWTATGDPKGYKGKLWKADCERVIELGWTATGQTNRILGTIAQYGRVFKGLGDRELERYILDTAISCPGYSEFCRHTHEIEIRCRDWAVAAQKAYSPYVGDRKGNAWRELRERKQNSANLETASAALERIKSAIAAIGDRVFGSIRERVRELCKIAQCSSATLYKYRNLWLGCNADNEGPVSDSDDAEKAIATDSESLESSPCGVLHPKSVYEGVRSLKPLEFSIQSQIRPPEIHIQSNVDPAPPPPTVQKPLNPY